MSPCCKLKNPCIIGETDVLEGSQTVPGVQSGGEGQSGLYVRGGSPDQNLILLVCRVCIMSITYG